MCLQLPVLKLSVPLITSADINAPHKQVTIQEIYDFMIKDVKEAIQQGLPPTVKDCYPSQFGSSLCLLGTGLFANGEL